VSGRHYQITVLEVDKNAFVAELTVLEPGLLPEPRFVEVGRYRAERSQAITALVSVWAKMATALGLALLFVACSDGIGPVPADAGTEDALEAGIGTDADVHAPGDCALVEAIPRDAGGFTCDFDCPDPETPALGMAFAECPETVCLERFGPGATDWMFCRGRSGGER